MTKRTNATTGQPVLVTDSHRGIYFGYLLETLEGGNAVRLERARHCYYYAVHAAHDGIYGLATGGPANGSKVGPRVTMTIRDVAKVVDCEPAAVERWEVATWGG